jgi:hypothetical protein
MEEPVWNFPFVGMKQKDSFFIPTNAVEVMAYKISTAAAEYGIGVIVKPRVEDGILGVRAWRLR